MNIYRYLNINPIYGGGRLTAPDVAKGIGIIMVVMGHCGGYEPTQAVISSFHMPLFFYLSGLFLFNKETSFKNFLQKKSKSLLVPLITFGLILCTYSTIIDCFRPHNALPLGLRYVGLFINMRQNPFPGSLWFFPCLFLVECFMFAIHYVNSSRLFSIAMSLLLVICGLGIHHFYGKGLPWSVDIALYCTIFTSIGYCTKEIVWKKRNSYSYLISLVIFLISVYYNYTQSGYIVDLYLCRLGNYPLFFLSAFTGIYCVIGLSHYLREVGILRYLGQNSMIIYSLHFLFLVPCCFVTKYIFDKGFLSNLCACMLVIILLIPIINIINSHFKWMTGKF